MKTLSSLFTMFLALSAHAAPAGAPNFGGAVPQPMGVSAEAVSQLTIRFPSGIQKTTSKSEPFKVACLPAVQGYSSWADNNTLWTYSLKAANPYTQPRLVGGSTCAITQIEDVTSADGTVWKAGTINYTLSIAGPNVIDVYPASGFNGSLRETSPVLLILFDGPVDRTKFFSEQTGYLSYTSTNAPSEKIALTAVPQDQAQAVFAQFKRTNYMEAEFADANWILATVSQNLIPGSQVSLNVENPTSAADPSVHSAKKFAKEFAIRSQLEAGVKCANPSAKTGNCLPNSPISVTFNGEIKWSDIKDSYIEYVPYKSTDGKLVRSYPELADDQEHGFWNIVFNAAGHYFPFLAKYSDTLVDAITFNVNAEPQTQVKIVLLGGIQDIDNRLLSSANEEFFVQIGAMSEVISLPAKLSFFEKNIPDLYLPVGVVNQNQMISIRKTGADATQWQPLVDAPSMIKVIRAYEARGNYRDTLAYTSPLEQIQVPSSTVDQQLTGTKNRPTFLQVPFAAAHAKPASGFYAMEVSSATYEATHSDAKDGRYYNPQYVLAQVTDLAVHVKRGETQSLVWVTRLSEAQPVAGAAVEIYNCLGEPVQALTTNASGLASFQNREWAKDCHAPQGVYSQFFSQSEFYVVAKTADDIALTHTSWRSSNSYAMGAPGVDFFYNDVVEGEPYFHAVIGVNLVKPGQIVPIQLIAKIPNSQGFSEIAPDRLPNKARISSADDEDVYYDFPLTWTNGTADVQWSVPSDSSVKLGRYTITLSGGAQAQNQRATRVSSGDIEVGEFKVPLMTGLIAFPTQDLVRPDSIPVNSNIRYANGVGAKKLGVEISYYFEPTSVQSGTKNKDLSGFAFGSGPVKLTEEDSSPLNSALPSRDRPATLQGLTTGADGSLVKDLALEKVSDGRTVAEVLKTLDRPQKLVVRLRYQDQMGEFQTLSQAKDIFNSKQYVGTSLTSGDRTSAKLRAAVIDVKGQNVTSLRDLDVKVIRVDAKVIGEELFGGLIKNTIERELKPVRWSKSCSVQNKIVSCQIGALKSGNYAFQVTSRSSKQASNTIFKVDDQGRVYGEADYYRMGDSESSKQLPLALNKKSYRNGERAVVSFPAPFKSCQALVSIERGDVIQASVVSNACEKGYVEVPVTATLAPNAFVSVYAITGRAPSASAKFGEKDLGRPTYRLGFANLKVDWSRFKSDVTVKTDKPKYRPGDTVNVQVHVRPEEGQLKGGTVTLVAIEEKILELKKNDTYNLLDALMQLRGQGVETITPLEHVETVAAVNPDMPVPAPASAPGGARKGGNEGGDGSSKSDFKRRLFNALVAFQSGIPVQNGVANFSFKANDSLTQFKVFAIASDASEKFGTGETVYLSEKDTQSFSNIPTVAHTGDNFPVRITVQNNGKKAGKYRAEVVATLKDSAGKVIGQKHLSQEVSIDHATSSAIEVGQVTIDESTASIDYSIQIYDANNKLVDSMEPASQMILPSTPLAVHDSYLMQVVNGSAIQSLTKELDALADKGEIRVSISKSLVTSALSQVQARFDKNTFADFFIESRFEKALLESSPAHPENLQQVLQTLLGYVDSRGFLKYYPQADRGSIWFTASVLNALQQEPWALKLVPQALSDKLKAGVASVLSKKVDPAYIGKLPMEWMRAQALMGRAAFAFNDVNLQAVAAQVSSNIQTQLQTNPAAFGPTTDTWSNYDLLNVWLLQVVASPKTALTSAFYQQLTSPAHLVHTGNTAQLAGRPQYSFFYTDEIVETSMLLLGHSLLHGDSGLAHTLATTLVGASRTKWYSTETMMAVAQGLKGFGRSYEAEPVSGTATVQVLETQKTGTIDWSQSTTAALVSPWPDAKATVQVTQSGQGQPWVGVQALTAVPLKASRGQGLAIDKQIRNVTRDSGYQSGDVIEVTLNIQASSTVSQVALQDPIPAGSNILSDAYGSFSSGEKSYSGYKLYFETLSAGLTVVKYQYQLNNPGTFHLPPTRAEGLFMPGIFGETPNAPITVK